MSKDRGTKNVKKAPADKSKGKAVSAYKAETKSGKNIKTAVESFVPKESKGSGKPKNG
jgi:hypothetical protein